LMLVARSLDGLADVAGRLPSRDGQIANTLSEDLADPKAPGRIMECFRKEFGAPDILINNAAIQGPIGFSWDNDWFEWQKTIQINLLAPIGLCRLCVPLMGQSSRGKILNISGGGATGPRERFSAYATAKAGLVRFSETLAGETRDAGIDVHCIAPGAMDTSMLERVLESGPSLAGEQEYENALKARRRGTDTVARAAALCAFLASPDCDGITGKLISAVWDPWETFPSRLEELRKTDIYTLRRIVPKDRGMNWEEP
ncbi:MAG: SDR family oxidoreductase, partial [Proteobacteria bacterium]|nr:SDR family oxidoreductase [Pseudomonadota bacterium]